MARSWPSQSPDIKVIKKGYLKLAVHVERKPTNVDE